MSPAINPLFNDSLPRVAEMFSWLWTWNEIGREPYLSESARDFELTWSKFPVI